MKQGLIFASARAKARELSLITEERLFRMTEAKNLDEALRILAEMNYCEGRTISAENFYDILSEEERITTQFLKDTAPKGIGVECFFMKNDYHNLKVLLKERYLNVECKEALVPNGNYDFEKLKDVFLNNKLGFVNSYMGEAVKNIEKDFETNGISPREIDTEVDKYLFKEISVSVKNKNTDKYIKKYFTFLADITNINTMLRTIKLNANFSFFEENFVEGGEIELYSFKKCGTDKTKFDKLIMTGTYKSLLANGTDSELSVFETASDDFLLKVFSENKGDMFSVAPIIGFYLGKLNEIKILRVVLISIKNKVDKDDMKKRMRKLYA